MKVLVGAFNQEKALVGAFSVITNFRMDLFQALESHASPPIIMWPMTSTGSGNTIVWFFSELIEYRVCNMEVIMEYRVELETNLLVD